MNKKAKIYKPAKSAMQSGHGKTAQWVLEFERQKPLWPDPLMGWTSSGDTLNQVRLSSFESCEAAVAHAEQEGLEYQILPTHERRIKPRNYSDNFRYKPASVEE